MTTLRRRGTGLWSLRPLRRTLPAVLACLAVGYFFLSADATPPVHSINSGYLHTDAFPLTATLRWALHGPSFSWPTLTNLLPYTVTPPPGTSLAPVSRTDDPAVTAAPAVPAPDMRERPRAMQTETSAPSVRPDSPATQPPVTLPADQPREVTFQPSSPTGYDTGGGVYIKNESGLSVDVSKLLSRDLPLHLSHNEVSVLLIHTHATESFWPDEMYPYTPTDGARTEDKDLNVVRLGDALQKILVEKGLTVMHDRNIYDYPSYTGSYSRALSSIEKYMKKYPSIQVVIDIHRDSIDGADGVTCKTIAETPEGKTAQMMLVVGTDGGSLPHDGWRENASLAVKLQKRLNEKIPNLMRPINLRKERFNQHATPGSLILEVGTSGNTLGEALSSIEIFGDVAGNLLAEYADP